MPYEASIDVTHILRSTLYLLEHSRYPEKESTTIQALVDHLHQAIAELEAAAKRPTADEDEAGDSAELA